MEKFTKTALVVLSVLLLISFGFNVYYNTKGNEESIKEKVIVTEKTDTIHDTIPVLKQEKIIKYVYDTLPIVTTKYDTVYCDNGQIDTIYQHNDTIAGNVEVPISQKEYSDDSTYTAWISGYRANLDSINVYRKTITIDREVTITKKDNKHWGFGPVIYGGYDFQHKQVGWGIGFGITYNILKW